MGHNRYRMDTRRVTKKIQDAIRNTATKTGYAILDNRRLVLNHRPVLYYQPDFVLLRQSALVVIEIELSTDARKAITGDIVRAGLIGARIFIGVAKDEATADIIEKYGDALTIRIREISRLTVVGVSATNQKKFVERLQSILGRRLP